MTLVASTPKRLWRSLGPLLLVLLIALPAHAATTDHATPTHTDVGVLVVVPDRGFLGNEEVRDAFDAFAVDRNARLLFVTDERSEESLDLALADLRKQGAKRIAVLPLVLSSADARWQLAQGWLDARRAQGATLAIATPYGASYLAVEDLSARLRETPTDKQRLVLVGYGAGNAAQAAQMRQHLRRMGAFASTLAPAAIDAVVYPVRKAKDATALRKQFSDAISAAHGALVVPVALAPRDDSMMDFSNWFGDDLPGDAQLLTSPMATSAALAQWMQRATHEARMHWQPLAASAVGVVALAHGADWFWNNDIKQALAPVDARHKLAYAFSMADPPVVQRAVRNLEKQGAQAIVVVRAFGMAASFLPTVQRMLGIDVEAANAATDKHSMASHGMADHGTASHAGSGHGMGMMHHGAMEHATLGAAPRIRSALPMVTVGGVGDDALLAKALLHNARSVSKDPARETVILVAHGQGEDKANQRWLDLLGSLATQMRAEGGDEFRAIRVATWREDWPDKNKLAVIKVRAMVTAAQHDGGRALIVPARINERGAADRYLKGLTFGWGRGFAQTPYFAPWFEQEIARGIDQLNHDADSSPTAADAVH